MKTTGIVVRTWNDAPISRRDSDGYADATAMCQANGKDWFDYQRLSRTTDYVTALADATSVAADQLVISTTTGPNHLRGTWIHPRLAVDLARWISPQFAVWMDGWFLDAVAAPQKLTPRPVASLKHTSTCVYCGASFRSPKPGIMYCSGRCTVAAHRCRKQGKHYPSSTAAALVPALPPGIHVVANSSRHANWLWAQAVEDHVSRALMAQIATGNRHQSQSAFQLHLLPAA